MIERMIVEEFGNTSKYFRITRPEENYPFTEHDEYMKTVSETANESFKLVSSTKYDRQLFVFYDITPARYEVIRFTDSFSCFSLKAMDKTACTGFYLAILCVTVIKKGIKIRLSKNSDCTTSSSSCSVDSYVNNSNDDKVLEDYFYDVNEAIEDGLDGVIDWTVVVFHWRQFKEYEYTPECKNLVDRLSGEDKSVMDWRSELLEDHEFTNKRFDPLKHQDWAYVKFITEHLIEVSNDFTELTKIDGLGNLKGSREILLITEFAGGYTLHQ
ncbi:hypothetical protein MFLAVUS_004097 [Mucor flavus]|uniref:Uncharacterized protein n=1 Tax=Mucor flavus TaxID=439312 RepID=A0ABP9YUX7_9FUNG